MIGYIATLLLAVAAATASLQGVDPNTLSCDPRGQEFLLLPHFTDCDKFYMCTHGREVEMPCAPGTIFDFPIQVCNHPWATECWLRQRPDQDNTTSAPETTTSAPETTNPEEEIDGSGEGSGYDNLEPASISSRLSENDMLNCFDPVAASKQVPFKGDCQRYWRCIDRVPHTFYCREGLYFNAQTEQCDFEANVKCVIEDGELQGEFILY